MIAKSYRKPIRDKYRKRRALEDAKKYMTSSKNDEIMLDEIIPNTTSMVLSASPNLATSFTPGRVTPPPASPLGNPPISHTPFKHSTPNTLIFTSTNARFLSFANNMFFLSILLVLSSYVIEQILASRTRVGRRHHHSRQPLSSTPSSPRTTTPPIWPQQQITKSEEATSPCGRGIL